MIRYDVILCIQRAVKSWHVTSSVYHTGQTEVYKRKKQAKNLAYTVFLHSSWHWTGLIMLIGLFLACFFVYLSKQYGARRLLRELPDKGWKLWSINSLLKRSHKTGTIVPLPGSVRPRLSRSREKPFAQSGGQAKKASVSSLDFAWNCHSQ